MATILVVDDNPLDLKLVRVVLAGEGHAVHGAADATELSRLLGRLHPDLILMDLRLPGADGLELTRRLKADPDRRAIPIIAITACAMKGDELRARAAGCDDYLAKPTDPDRLVEVVVAHLQRGPRA